MFSTNVFGNYVPSTGKCFLYCNKYKYCNNYIRLNKNIIIIVVLQWFSFFKFCLISVFISFENTVDQSKHKLHTLYIM